MRSLVLRSQQNHSHPLLASSWVESSPTSGSWKGDTWVDWSTSRKSSLQVKIRTESSTATVERTPMLDQQEPPSSLSSSSSHCPSRLFRTPTAPALRKHKPDRRNHPFNHQGGTGGTGSGTTFTPQSPTSSCGHVSFCEQVHMVYIPKLESHQVTNLFYDATDLELFRQEVAMERLSRPIQQEQHLPPLSPPKMSIVVEEEEDDDYYYYEEVVEEEEYEYEYYEEEEFVAYFVV
jgi:hypothetical protein